MTRRTVVALLLCTTFASCSRRDEPAAGADALTGTWVGDFGPAFYDRNTISLQLKWDGARLTGMVQPGVPGERMYRNFTGFPIENASFDPKTGTVKFETTYQPRGRRYFVEGKIKRGTLMGTWIRPDDKRDGDFRLTRKSS